jgi:ABC-2 type transport system ATP-binding protein
VDEYLRFCARLRRLSGGAIAGAVDLCKQRCGLTEVGKRLIANLSRGYQQRVGLAQAIVHSPAVVVLDEPTVGLDPIQIIEIRELIRALDKDHAVILSTHILTEVQDTCDRVLIINEGSLVLDENIHTLQSGQQRYRFSIALKCPPGREQLESVSGISGVDCVDRNHFYINCRDNLETPARLAELAAVSGWGLYELIPVKDSLEDTFLRLTSGAVTSMPLEAD